MIHPDIWAALARERSGTFLAEAEAARRARQARPSRRPAAVPGARGFRPAWLAAWLRLGRDRAAATGTQVVLPDGSQVQRDFGADLVRRGGGELEYEIELACQDAAPLYEIELAWQDAGPLCEIELACQEGAPLQAGHVGLLGADGLGGGAQVG